MQTSGRVTFSTTPVGTRTVYEMPPDARYQPAQAQPADVDSGLQQRVLSTQAAGRPVLSTPVGGGGQYYRGEVREIGGDAMYQEPQSSHFGVATVAMPAPTRVVNPPPFGYTGVIYDKGQHRGQARADQPRQLEVRHRQDTGYSSQVMHAPHQEPNGAREGISPEQGVTSRIVSRTVYPSRVVHPERDDNEPRNIPAPGMILASGTGIVSQQGYMEPRVSYEEGPYARRGGNLHMASQAASHPATQGMPWSRNFSQLPASSNVPWQDVVYAQMPKEKLVGYSIAPQVGLRVDFSSQGRSQLKTQSIGPQLSRGKPGYITRINPEKDAVLVQWEAVDRHTEGESGWYRIGAYGEYSLLVCNDGNRDEEILRRAQRVSDEGMFSLGVTELGY